MARIQQSIEIGVPVHIAYSRLTQFEDYPRFMQDVETVHQLDDTHLHWSARMAYQTMEWDSEITEQIPGHCIAWRNAGGPIDAGKVELQPVGQDKSRVTLIMECAPEHLPARAGNVEDVLARQVGDDLVRLKDFIESRDAENDRRLMARQIPLDFGPEEAHAAEVLAKSMKQGKRRRKAAER